MVDEREQWRARTDAVLDRLTLVLALHARTQLIPDRVVCRACQTPYPCLTATAAGVHIPQPAQETP